MISSNTNLSTEDLLFVNSEVEKRKPNTLVAYLLWFFLGGFGAHRFYFKKNGSAIAMILLLVSSVFLTFFLIGIFGLIIGGIWVLVDAFLIPKWSQEEINKIERETIEQLQARQERTTAF